MYITNIEQVEDKIGCNKILADYLVKSGIPILGMMDKIYYFSMTKKVEEKISNCPTHIKLFSKVVS